MSLIVKIDSPSGAGLSSEAIELGRFLVRSGTGKTLAKAGAQAWAVGVAANSAAAAGDDLKVYLPGQFCKVECASAINASNGGQVPLGVDADGKARAAVAGDRIVALLVAGEGESVAAGDLVTVRLTDGLEVHA